MLNEMRHHVVTAMLAMAACLLPTRVRAQAGPPAVVHVLVLDTAREPVAGATVVILRGPPPGQALHEGTTDAAGRCTFAFVPDSGPYRFVARRIGYAQTTRPLAVAAGDTLFVPLSLARLPPMLDTVRIEARALSNDYFLDSTAILRAARDPAIENVYDVLMRLRPNMLGDHGRICDDIAFVWVNGHRVRLDETLSIPPRDVLIDPRTRLRKRHLAPTDILAGIRPGDIASMQYKNCWDTSMPGIGSENALYITLKPGIAFDEARGSYRIDSIPRSPQP